jgi:hypothetical protein
VLHARLAAFTPSARVAPDSKQGRALVWMVSRLRDYASSKWRFWEWPLWPLRRAPRLWWLTRQLTHQLLANLFGGDDALGKSNMKQVRAMRRTNDHRVAKEYRDGRETWALENDTPDARQAFAERLVLDPVKRRGITTDAEVLDSWDDRAIDLSSLRDLQARDRRRSDDVRALGQASARAAEALKREVSTESLLKS